MPLSHRDLFGLIIATSFAAGLNLYATLATLGLLSRAGLIALPSSLHLIQSWWIIASSLTLFGIEFIADKIPAFDLIWNALHTFIRVPIAGLVAYQATSQLSPQLHIMAAVLGGVIAFAAHGGKTAARALIMPSPEPFSNMALSVSEDVVAVGLTWFATRHPFAAAAIVAILLILIVWFVRVVIRAMRKLFRGAESAIEAKV